MITPDFNYENDEGVEIGDAFWNNSRPWGDWRAGAHSSPKSGQYAALRLERLPGKGRSAPQTVVRLLPHQPAALRTAHPHTRCYHLRTAARVQRQE